MNPKIQTVPDLGFYQIYMCSIDIHVGFKAPIKVQTQEASKSNFICYKPLSSLVVHEQGTQVPLPQYH